MRPGGEYDNATLLEEARREMEGEESRRQDSVRAVRWWSAGCLAVTTLHGALPFELLTGLDGWAVRGAAACVIASLVGWAWAAWGSVRRLRPFARPSRPESLRQAFLRGKAAEPGSALQEIWGNPDKPNSQKGILPIIIKETDASERSAKGVYNRVRAACVVTGSAAAVAMVVIVLGSP